MPSENIPIFFKQWSNKLNDWKRICLEKNIDFLEAALNFVIKQENIDYCLIGVENLDQLKECILAAQSSKVINVSELACNDSKLLNPFNWKLK